MEFKKQVGSLNVKGFPTRNTMGNAAAAAVAERLKQLLNEQEQVNVVFAAAPSQNEFIASLIQTEGIDWQRVNAFHMDEYIGLPAHAPQRFGNFLKEGIFSKIPLGSIHYLDGSNPDPEAEATRYAELLARYPLDIVCMGIGENSHIAFNDPHVADFEDKYDVKIVDLDMACRQQQVNDGCFAVLDEVPTHALTLTIPAMMAARYIYCMVPGLNKAVAVKHTLTSDITPQYPSTILRKHPNAELYIDADSASLLDKE